jgi:hypothetical protein
VAREHELLRRTLNERLVLSSIREQEHADAEALQRAQLNALLENLSEGVAIAEPKRSDRDDQRGRSRHAGLLGRGSQHPRAACAGGSRSGRAKPPGWAAPSAPVIARLANEGGSVAIDVVDRGIGIAPESVQLLFGRYYRTTAGKAHASGLGLGLYISPLCRGTWRQGGKAAVSSEVDKGSTFRMTLPLHTG